MDPEGEKNDLKTASHVLSSGEDAPHGYHLLSLSAGGWKNI